MRIGLHSSSSLLLRVSLSPPPSPSGNGQKISIRLLTWAPEITLPESSWKILPKGDEMEGGGEVAFLIKRYRWLIISSSVRNFERRKVFHHFQLGEPRPGTKSCVLLNCSWRHSYFSRVGRESWWSNTGFDLIFCTNFAVERAYENIILESFARDVSWLAGDGKSSATE